MTIFLTFFFFFLIISFLVFIHELGHFAAAKLTRVGVKTFAIGFGPKLVSFEFRNTEYKINVLPLGGYVQLEGEDNESVKGGFRDSVFPVKFAILIGGVVMNILGAILLLGIQLNITHNIVTIPKYSDFNFTNTVSQANYYPIYISEVNTDFSWESDFGSAIVEINKTSFTNLSEFEELVDSNRGNLVEIKYIDIGSGKISLKNDEYKIGGLYQGKYPLFEITEVIENSNMSGKVEEGEILVGVNGEYFTSRKAFNSALRESIKLDSENSFIFLDLEKNEEYSKKIRINSVENGQPLLGIKYNLNSGYSVSVSNSQSSFYFIEYKDNALSSVAFTYDMTIYQIKSLGTIFSNAFSTGDFTEVSENFGGPVKVGNVVNEVVQYDSLNQLFGIAGLISLSLAIFNILPIPALDGGQIVIAAVESLRRKKLSDSVVNKINAGGFFLLIGLSILIFVKDVLELNLFQSFFEIIKNALGK